MYDCVYVQVLKMYIAHDLTHQKMFYYDSILSQEIQINTFTNKRLRKVDNFANLF